MAKQPLAIKYRPRTFDELCGQQIVAKILTKAIEQRNFKHAYLFAGDSGCGKTSCARIFARMINQGSGEPIELDAASQRDIETIRAITDSANQRSLDSEYKVYIIDECQSYTIVQWQAFLRSIEEAPEYTIYMFCTEPQKLPATILNRLQRYNITKIDTETVKNRLKYICQQEGFTNYEQACDLISKISNGCMRDAIMRLDQCANFSTDLNIENAKQVLTDISYEAMFKLTWALQDKKEEDMLSVIDKLYSSGNDLKNFINNYLEFILDLSKYILFKNIELTNIPGYFATTENPVVQQTVQVADSLNWFKKLADLLLTIKLDIKYDTYYKSTIEAYLLRACR